MGSSSNRNLGSEISALDMANICLSPPESEAARSYSLFLRSGNISRDRSILSARTPGDSEFPPIWRFSKTDRDGKTLSTCGT